MNANNSVKKEILKKSNIAALIITLISLIAAAIAGWIAGWYATQAFETTRKDLEEIKKNIAQSRQLAEESLKKADESLKHQQIIDAWQILTTRVAGNGGKKDAIETLLAAGQEFTGIDLSSETQGGSVFLQNLQAANANLSFAKLQDVVFGRANLQGAAFVLTKLQEAIFGRANLQGAGFILAKLQYANFREAILYDANFSSANLESTKFSGADISGADFEGAGNLDLAKWSDDDGTAPAFALKTNLPKNLPPEILEKIELLGDEEYQARKKEWLQNFNLK